MQPELTTVARVSRAAPRAAANDFPLDLENIRTQGIASWAERFFWPISWQQFHELEDKVTAVFDELSVRFKNSFVGDLLLIDYKCHIEYTNLIHDLLVLQHLRKRGLQPAFSKDSRLEAISRTGIPARPLLKKAGISAVSWLASKYGALKLFRQVFRPKSLAALWGSDIFITDASLSHFTIDYLNFHFPGRVKAKPFSEWLGRPVAIGAGNQDKIDEACNALLTAVAQVVSEYNLKFNPKQKKYLYELTREQFLNSYELLLRVQQKLAKRGRPVRLFLGSNHGKYCRLLAVAVRKFGGSVTTFSHGEPVNYYWNKVNWMELALADTYVEYSPALVSSLERTRKSFFVYNNQATKIESHPCDYFAKLRREKGGIKAGDKIQTVMMLPNIYKESGFTSVTAFAAPYQFYLERTILQALADAGYTPLYKKHTGGAMGMLELPFDIPGLQIITAPFERVMDQTDAYLFYYTRTSTFGAALCTNKPIIVIDDGREKIETELRRLLEQRCLFIQVRTNDRNLPEFAPDAFANLGESLAKAQNSEEFRQYLFDADH